MISTQPRTRTNGVGVLWLLVVIFGVATLVAGMIEFQLRMERKSISVFELNYLEVRESLDRKLQIARFAEATAIGLMVGCFATSLGWLVVRRWRHPKSTLTTDQSEVRE